MTTGDNKVNSNTTTIAASTAPERFNVREVVEAAQQLQESLSSFLKEDLRYHENLITIIKQATGQPEITDAEALKNSAEIEKLDAHLPNNHG